MGASHRNLLCSQCGKRARRTASHWCSPTCEAESWNDAVFASENQAEAIRAAFNNLFNALGIDPDTISGESEDTANPDQTDLPF